MVASRSEGGAHPPAPKQVVAEIVVAAPCPAVYAAISDPTQYGRWSPEATGAKLPGPLPLQVGAQFTGHSRVWLPWRASCTVVAAEPDREFGFDVRIGGVPVSRWTFQTSPSGQDRTLVRQIWQDQRGGTLGRFLQPLGALVGRGRDAARRNTETMAVTLARLKDDLESGAAGAPE